MDKQDDVKAKKLELLNYYLKHDIMQKERKIEKPAGSLGFCTN